MQPTGTPNNQGAALEQLWQQVCASRGTPAPEAGQRAQFLQGLAPEARSMLETVLLLATRGRERPGDLGLVSWAASCTRPALLSQLQTHGLNFTSAGLFACGLKLRQEGWDMQHRIAQLAGNPTDVDTLRALLPVEPGEPQAPPPQEAAPGRPKDAAADAVYFPWPDDHAPVWEGEPMDDMPVASTTSPSAPPTRSPSAS